MGNASSAETRQAVEAAVSAVPDVVPLNKDSQRDVIAAVPCVFNVIVLKGKCLPKGRDGSHDSCVDLTLRTRKFEPQAYRTSARAADRTEVRFNEGFTFSIHPAAIESAVLCLSILSDSATQLRAQREVSVKHLLRNGSKKELIVFGRVQDSTQALPSLKILAQIVDVGGLSACTSPEAPGTGSVSLYSSGDSSLAGVPAAPGSSGGLGNDLILSHGIGFVKSNSIKLDQVDDGRMHAVVDGTFEELNLNTTVSPSSSLFLATSPDSPELVVPRSRSGDTNTTFASSTSSLSTPDPE